jgi:aminoglycoside phosphotransferase (APT) family kinase protein
MAPEGLQEELRRFLGRWCGWSLEIEGLRLLSGGASRESWAFDARLRDGEGGEQLLPLVYRSAASAVGPGFNSLEMEYLVLRAAYLEGVPVPRVYPLLPDPSQAPQVTMLVMDRVPGETIPRRILRDDAYAEARRRLARQLGEALARIHRIPLEKHGLQALPSPPPGCHPALHQIERWEELYRLVALDPQPVLELALRWLRQHLPRQGPLTLIHGDYRMGNLVVGPEGLRAVLDWELAHIGDPVEDLAWACIRSWRFGNDHLPAAGLGTREELREAYEAAGGPPVDEAAWRFWEAFGNVRWAVLCVMQARRFAERDPDLYIGLTGRRVAETEWELLHFLEGL